MLPILYSYRRCPYAMRARLAIFVADISVEIREIVLRDKPAHMLQVSPKGTVPVLILQTSVVIEQSLDIMFWALRQYDLQDWLDADSGKMQALITENDTYFKQTLDSYKYPERYPQFTQTHYRQQGEKFLQHLEHLLNQNVYLFKDTASLADMAIFPFVRQFAAVDLTWFESSNYPKLQNWLNTLVNSELFERVMKKQPTYIA
ncbi:MULTISPECIES: glutathione S-transferase [Methylotenera]|uniref:glutathione S-transferase n=1 Tax=Methylotenera TaxID=359407 RepID=UPI0003758D70|nr:MULTISPECIES: glutathione S-transferase [Methylotenera]